MNTTDKVTIPFEEMYVWTIKIFQATGMNEDHTRIVADNLVTADVRGVYSHGVMRVPDMLKDEVVIIMEQLPILQ